MPTAVHLVKAMVFTVVTYECENWTIKKTEQWRIDVFELWCWRRLLSPLDCKEIKSVNPKRNESWCWSWNSNALATWCEELTHLKRPWCCKRLKAGREGDNRDWDCWLASPTWRTWIWASSGSWWWTGKPGMLQSMGLQRVGHDWTIDLNWKPSDILDSQLKMSEMYLLFFLSCRLSKFLVSLENYPEGERIHLTCASLWCAWSLLISLSYFT